MNFYKDDLETGIIIWKIRLAFAWHTDVCELLPFVRIWAGYIKGIHDGEISLEIGWLTLAIYVHYSKHIEP